MKVYYYTLIAFIQGVVLLSPEGTSKKKGGEKHTKKFSLSDQRCSLTKTKSGMRGCRPN